MQDKMTQQLISKILSYLSNKEGYSVSFDANDTLVIVQDSMGFRFSIDIEPQGRTQRWCLKDDFDFPRLED